MWPNLFSLAIIYLLDISVNRNNKVQQCVFTNLHKESNFLIPISQVIKTRQQLQGELVQKSLQATASNPYSSVWHSVRSILKAEGIFGLQKGLVSALAFQFVMNSTRLGTYQTADNLGWTRDLNGEVSTVRCIWWGGIAGIVGSSLGCPLYMIKTQLQAQSQTRGKYAVGFQHDHHGTVDALRTIYRQHGVKGLWRGCTSIIPRTMVASSAQLATFSKCKEFVQQYSVFEQSVFLTAVLSSMVSGFFACVCMTPFDVIATRMFNQGRLK